MIRIKRSYEARSPDDGKRFLVDRLWPRGMKKQALAADAWLKDIAPSPELRRWFDHRTERWAEFQKRYAAELDGKPETWRPILEAAREGDVTLLYSARDVEHNGAIVLRDYLARQGAARRKGGG